MSQIFELLDKEMPDWWMRVDLKSPSNVLPQLYGSHTKGLIALKIIAATWSGIGRTEAVSERVAKAPISELAKYLDHRAPDWWTKIDVNALNQNHPNMCVLGQLFSHWEIGLRTLGLDVGRISEPPSLSGFGSEESGETRKRDAWTQEINNRKMGTMGDIFKELDAKNSQWWIKVDCCAEKMISVDQPCNYTIGGWYAGSLSPAALTLNRKNIVKAVTMRLSDAKIPDLALWLDEWIPNWWNTINPKMVKKNPTMSGILEQLIEDWREICPKFGIDPGIRSIGFASNSITIQASEKLWKEEICKRRGTEVTQSMDVVIPLAVAIAELSWITGQEITVEYLNQTTLAQFLNEHAGKGKTWKL